MTDTLDGLLSSLGRASWQGALALLFAWLLCRVLARRLIADAHCWFWRLGYVKLLIGLLWGGAILLPLLSPFPSSPPLASLTLSVSRPLPIQGKPAETSSVAPHAAVAGPMLSLRWQTVLATAYGFGVVVCLCRLLRAAGRTWRILRHATPNVPEPEMACAAGLARDMGLRRIPALARSAEVSSPVLIAGRVLLPAEAQYGEDELRMILAHELAHARRRDLLWEWLGTLVQVTFFFHPLVVLARREERLAREAAADALALRTTGAAAADYGSLLLSLSLGQAGPRSALVGAVGVIEGGSPLRRRLLALRDGAAHANTRRKGWRLALVLVPLLALIFLPWQMTHGQAQPPATASASAPSGYSALPIGSKRIVGVIRDGAGKPVLGVGVQLVWRSVSQDKDGIWHEAPAGNVSTNAQGRFSFSSLPAGAFDYTIISPKDRYVPIQGSLVISATDAQKDLHLTVSTGSFVTGRVVDGRTGRPTAGVSVVAGSVPQGGNLAQWDYWTMPSGTTTDVQGYYRLHVTPGSIAVGVGRMTGNTHRIDERVREAMRKVVVRLGQTASAPDLPVFLYPIIAFTGPDGRPLANTVVRIIPRGIQYRGEVRDITTDTAGDTVLNPLRLGEQPSITDSVENYSFSVNQNNHYASGIFQWSPGQPLVIEVNGETLNFPDGAGTVQMTEGSATFVVGRVVSEDGRPIPDALVTVFETDPKSHYGLGRQSFRADAAGVFRLPLDPNGQFHAYVRADGFNQASVSDQPLALAKGQAMDLGPVRLTRADGSISGRIVDTSGRPMLGVVASVQGQKTGISATLTDDQGRFRIPNVVPGETLRLTLCLKGEVPDSGEALYQSNEQMDFSGVQASPTEREIVWHPQPGGY